MCWNSVKVLLFVFFTVNIPIQAKFTFGTTIYCTYRLFISQEENKNEPKDLSSFRVFRFICHKLAPEQTKPLVFVFFSILSWHMRRLLQGTSMFPPDYTLVWICRVFKQLVFSFNSFAMLLFSCYSAGFGSFPHEEK